jgi:Rrf2 family transcriptional regulator, iron-sulfur cluster assembly transcription factor
MLSMTSEYALRAMAWLAAQPSGRATLGRDLAESAAIPANYLAKILVTLRNAGLVATVRGAGGGYMLHRQAKDVRLSEIVELFEGSCLGSGCALNRSRECMGKNTCTAHDAWAQVRNAYRQFLDQTTLADISVHAPGLSSSSSQG